MSDELLNHVALIDTIYAAALGDASWEDALQGLRCTMGTRTATLLSYDDTTQLALIEHAALIDALVAAPPFRDDAPARQLARIGLANYFAGAVLLPYTPFRDAAERLRHDIDLLAQQFGVGFETVCHRLSTLQRADALQVGVQHIQGVGLCDKAISQFFLLGMSFEILLFIFTIIAVGMI